jgi:hypothetical protein
VGHNVVSTTTPFISRHLECFVANDEVRSNGIDCCAADLSNTELFSASASQSQSFRHHEARCRGVNMRFISLPYTPSVTHPHSLKYEREVIANFLA